eukprot:5425280-Amphidinium_carterae.2
MHSSARDIPLHHLELLQLGCSLSTEQRFFPHRELNRCFGAILQRNRQGNLTCVSAQGTVEGIPFKRFQTKRLNSPKKNAGLA